MIIGGQIKIINRKFKPANAPAVVLQNTQFDINWIKSYRQTATEQGVIAYQNMEND